MMKLKSELENILSVALDLGETDRLLLIEELIASLPVENRSYLKLKLENLVLSDANQSKRVYTVAQAAKAIRVSTSTISRWFDMGKLNGYRISSGLAARVRYADLVKFLKDKNQDGLIPGNLNNERWCYTTGQVAKIVGVSSGTVHRWIKRNELRGYFVPGAHERRIHHASLIKLAEEQGRDIVKSAAA